MVKDEKELVAIQKEKKEQISEMSSQVAAMERELAKL